CALLSQSAKTQRKRTDEALQRLHAARADSALTPRDRRCARTRPPLPAAQRWGAPRPLGPPRCAPRQNEGAELRVARSAPEDPVGEDQPARPCSRYGPPCGSAPASLMLSPNTATPHRHQSLPTTFAT